MHVDGNSVSAPTMCSHRSKNNGFATDARWLLLRIRHPLVEDGEFLLLQEGLASFFYFRGRRRGRLHDVLTREVVAAASHTPRVLWLKKYRAYPTNMHPRTVTPR